MRDLPEALRQTDHQGSDDRVAGEVDDHLVGHRVGLGLGGRTASRVDGDSGDRIGRDRTSDFTVSRNH